MNSTRSGPELPEPKRKNHSFLQREGETNKLLTKQIICRGVQRVRERSELT